MSHDKPQKMSKQLRLKAQEFLMNRKNSVLLMEIIQHFESDMSSTLLAIELVFTQLLKDRMMYVEVVPLKPVEKTLENQYREWLRSVYETCFMKAVACIEDGSCKIQFQGLSTAMNFLSCEGKFPLESKGTLETYVPLGRLKAVLMKLLSSKQNHLQLISKYTEYLLCNDVLFFTWKLLPNLTAKSNPNEIYIGNYLCLLEKLQVDANVEENYLCGQNGNFFTFEQQLIVKWLNKLWNCIMQWEHTRETHKQLLIILLEKNFLKYLEKPILLTDFLMDSLDLDGPISLLALQGIFTMIQVHNLNYPNIFTKLYSMFEPEIFHTKYKARLFYLSDLFLSSTHLPETLVAAFAKRLARLALVAPSEDVIIICMFIGNLILRHPGLKCLLNRQSSSNVFINEDPYVMEEGDPLKSNAINSSLWEIQTLQQHLLPNVSTAAKFINTPLPSIEWDLSKLLNTNGDDYFDKELKKYSKLITLTFDNNNGTNLLHNKSEKMFQYWNF